jgi:hypothetical protein
MRNKKSLLVLGISVGLATATLTGCSTFEPGRNNDDRSAGRVVDDHQIAREIHRDLRDEPVYKFQGVHVDTYAGIVQLSGFVNTDDQRRRAGEVARDIPGVAQVQNNIVLKPNVGANMSASGRNRQRIYSQPYNPDRVEAPSQGSAANQNLQTTPPSTTSQDEQRRERDRELREQQKRDLQNEGNSNP